MNTAVLCIEGLRVERRDGERRFCLEVPQFVLEAGARVALVGPSGSGKSTLMEVLALASPPAQVARFVLTDTAGTVHDVRDYWHLQDDEALTRLRARALGYVQQRAGLPGFLRVDEILQLGLRLAQGPTAPDPAAARQWCERLGIGAAWRALPAHLSVGQCQRVAVARALIHRPSLVLADEATAALDRQAAEAVMRQLVELAESGGSALLLATHDEALAQAFGFTPVRVEIHPQAQGQLTRVPPTQGGA